MTQMRLSLLVITSLVLGHVAAQRSPAFGSSAGHGEATKALRGSKRTSQEDAVKHMPQLALNSETVTSVTPLFCKKKVNALKKKALNKIHFLNHTLLATQQNLTKEQDRRTAAEQNASSLASQLAALSQAHVQLMDKFARAMSREQLQVQKQNQIEKKEHDSEKKEHEAEKKELEAEKKELEAKTRMEKMNDELSEARKELATEEGQLNTTHKVLQSAGLEMKRMKMFNAELQGKLSQTHRQFSEMSGRYAETNKTSEKQAHVLRAKVEQTGKELNATLVQLSAEEAKLQSARKEASQLRHALQESESVKSHEMEQVTRAHKQLGQLTDAIANLTSSNSQEKREIESSNKQVASVTLQLRNARNEGAKLEQTLNLEEQVTAKDAKEIQELRSEIVTANSSISKESKELNSLKATMSVKNKELTAALANADEQGTKLRQAKSDLSSANAQVSETQKHLQEIKAALTDARELGAKLRHNSEMSTQAKDQQLEAASKAEKELRNKLHIAEVSMETQNGRLKALSEYAKELQQKLHKSEALAKSEDQKLKAAGQGAHEVMTKLHTVQESIMTKDLELKAESEATKELGVKLQLFKVQEVQDLKAASQELNASAQESQRLKSVSERLAAKLRKTQTELGTVKNHEDQELKVASKEASRLEDKLHNTKAKLDDAYSKIRVLSVDKAELSKLRSGLRSVSAMAAKQTQAFRNFEYVDEQLRAELNNVAAVDPADAEGTAKMDTVEAKAVEMPAEFREKAKAAEVPTELREKVSNVADKPVMEVGKTGTVPPKQDQVMKQKDVQDSEEPKLPKASLLSSNTDENAEVVLDFLRDTDVDPVDENAEEDLLPQDEAEFSS